MIDILIHTCYHYTSSNNKPILGVINVINNNIWRLIMKKLSIPKMSDTIISKRKELKMTQVQLAEATGINRGMISRLESCDYTPSIDQLQAIAEVLHFEVVDLFEDDKPAVHKPVLDKKYSRVSPMCLTYNAHRQSCRSAMMRREVLCR